MPKMFEIGTAGATPRYIWIVSNTGDSPDPMASDKASYITGETIYIYGGRLGLNYIC